MALTIAIHDEAAAHAAVESMVWPNGPQCPRCGPGTHVGRLAGASTSYGTWKCYRCRKPFTVRSLTPFRNSHIPLHAWLQAAYLIAATRNAIGTLALSRSLGITFKAGAELRKRIEAYVNRDPEPGSLRDIHMDTAPADFDDDARGKLSKARHQRFLALIAGRDRASDELAFAKILGTMLAPDNQAGHGTNRLRVQLSLHLD